MENQLNLPKENKLDYAHRFVKSTLGIVPFAGTALGELFSVILPPSIESRRDKWLNEISKVLNDLMEQNKNLLNELSENEDFISLLLETSQLALKTHREEKLKLYSMALKNSLNMPIDFFLQETYIRYIDELNPNQVMILNFISTYQDRLIDVNSYMKYHNLLTQGSIGLSPIIDSNIDASTVRYFFQDMDKKGLIIISESIEELENVVRESSYLVADDSNDGLPYIKITEFGQNFLEMIKGKTA